MFEKCFNDIMAGASAETRARWQRTFEAEFIDLRGKGKSYEQALTEAGKTASSTIRNDNALKLLRDRLQAIAASQLETYKQTRPGGDAGDAMLRYLVFREDQKGGVVSMESQADGYFGMYQRPLLAAMREVGHTHFGFIENAEGIEAFARSSFGERVDDAAVAKVAETYQQVRSTLVDELNARGAAIRKSTKNVLPQSHNRQRMLDENDDGKAWVEKKMRQIDRSDPEYRALDGTPMSDDQLRTYLKEAWFTIVTEGALKQRIPGAAGPAGRHGTPRRIIFKDADAWLEHHREYGDTSLFQMMQSELKRMSTDLAILEYLGPRSRQQITAYFQAAKEALKDKASKGAVDRFAALKLSADEIRALVYYDYMAGNIERQPPSSWLGEKVQATFEALHHAASLLLGSSGITSLSDNATLQVTARAAGVNGTEVFINQMRALNPKDKRYKMWIENSGLVGEVYRSEMAKFGTEFSRSTLMGTASAQQMRLSLLPAMTKWRKAAFSTAMSNTIGHMTRKFDYGQLVKADARTLKPYGVDKATWEIWRAAEVKTEGFGQTLLDVDAVLESKVGTEAARRKAAGVLAAIIHSETRMAVIEPGVRERAIVAKAANLPFGVGYLASAFLQFKMFPIALATRHLGRALAQPGWQRGAYLAGLGVGMTMMGAVSIQAMQLFKGQDLRDMDDLRFWGSALLKGGSLGIYGDFLYATQNQYGKKPIETLAGPIGGMVGDAVEIGQLLATGEWDKALEQTIRLGKSVTPTTSLFYLRAAWDHYVFDQLQEAANPGYLARMQQRAYSRYGTQWWWEPGEPVPERAPEFAESPE